VTRTDPDAVARVAAFVAACDQLDTLNPDYPLTDRLARLGAAEEPDFELTRTDLRAVLAEVQRLTDELVQREDDVPSRITAETERDDLKTKLAAALSTVTALTQTIRAIPDAVAVANAAANLAHARAERDRLRIENKRLHEKITAAQAAISSERNFAMLRLDTDTAPGIVLLDALAAVENALAGPLTAAIIAAAVDGIR
jgi:chromosome segregation ATPase